MNDELKESFTNKAKSRLRPLRVIRIIINLTLLLTTIIIVIQNAHSIPIDFLWLKFEISLGLLLFITGSIGSVITLFFLLFKK